MMITVMGILSAGATGYFGWLFGRKKTIAEATTVEIENEIKLSDYYKIMLDDLSQRYENRFLELEQLYLNKGKVLEDEMSMLKQKIAILTAENRELRKRINELEKIE